MACYRESYRDSYRSNSSKIEEDSNSWSGLALDYNPIAIGSIDGTDDIPHDRGIIRAMRANYRSNPKIKRNPENTLFVWKLHSKTDEMTIQEKFRKFGTITSCSVIRDIVTGESKRYAFVEYDNSRSAHRAYKYLNNEFVDGCKILIDYEAEKRLRGWVPRRLGGGFGGKKESGQLRFGCRTRPFQKPIVINTKYPNTKNSNLF